MNVTLLRDSTTSTSCPARPRNDRALYYSDLFDQDARCDDTQALYSLIGREMIDRCTTLPSATTLQDATDDDSGR